MDDSKPANEPNEPGLNKIDLSQLQDFTFGTQWTEVKNTPGGPRREREDRRDRRDDAGGAPRDRRAFRRPAGAPAPSGPGAAPDPGYRGPQGDRSRGDGFRGGPRRDFRPGGDRGERRDFRGGDRRDGPMERGPYISPYFTMTCYPEDAGFAAMVKAVRASCRTFQLFEITKAVLEKNERFVVVIQRKSERAERGPAENAGEAAAPRAEKPAPIYMSVPDHLPFETEEAALHHVMANHLATFFSTQDVEIDPPKGNFPIINKCGITGELLGPPNYHRYQQILQQHHAARLGRMPFDRFRESIQSVREPEVVQQWMDKMKKATRYTWIYGQKPAAPKPADAAAADARPAEPAAETASAAPAEPAVPAEAAPAEGAPAPAAETPATPAAAAGPSFDSLEEARAYLLANAKDKAVRAVDNVRFHGRLIEKLPPGEIRRAVEGHVERQRRFPLDTANALRGRLRREGFTIFKKGSRGVSFVCAVKRRFRVPGQVFSESITSLIDFVEKHPLIHVKDLPKEMLGIDVAAAAAAAATPPAEGAPASTAPFVLPPEQAEKLRKMTNDLRWLVTEGYVTEFSDGKLFAPPPMSPAAQKKADEHGEEHDPVDFPETPSAKSAEEPAPEDTEPVAAGEGGSAAEPATAGESATAPEPEATKPEGAS
ncbi:MAG TPA: hypothetical protein VEB66_05250 [Opitutaceae bacterium]|nr:hypothetical protein [Opitutaceae bacterium]